MLAPFWQVPAYDVTTDIFTLLIVGRVVQSLRYLVPDICGKMGKEGCAILSRVSSNLGITRREDNFSDWYNELVVKGDLADHSAVRGCMVIKPHGYALWELMQRALDDYFKATGHVNAYFPLFIPKS